MQPCSGRQYTHLLPSRAPNTRTPPPPNTRPTRFYTELKKVLGSHSPSELAYSKFHEPAHFDQLTWFDGPPSQYAMGGNEKEFQLWKRFYPATNGKGEISKVLLEKVRLRALGATRDSPPPPPPRPRAGDG